MESFVDELLFFIEMCGEEQMLQSSHQLPTVEEYIKRRQGSSGVRVCLAIMEYACGISLSHEVLCDEAMRKVWYETNMNISA